VPHHCHTLPHRAGLTAVDTLVAVTTDEAAATGARVSAAKALLDLMYRDVAADLEARLGNLEARLGQGAKPPPIKTGGISDGLCL